jgi:hypothetical protein
MRIVAEMRGRPGAAGKLILRQRRVAAGGLFQRTKSKTAARHRQICVNS